MTTPSPSTVGRTATRMSRRRPAAFAFREMRPSCGLRRSAMSSLASTLRRVVTPGASRLGIRWSSCRTPSTRERTTRASSCGSKWMSLAPSSAAWRMIELTRRTSGASETPSSASRSSPSSSSSAEVELLLDEGRALPGLGGALQALQLEVDLLDGRDPDLERVARGQPQLVDRLDVRRVGDGDAEAVAGDLVRDRLGALEDVRGDRLGGELLHAGREVDVRQVVALGELARLVAGCGGRRLDARPGQQQLRARAEALVHDRLGQRAGAGARARSRRGGPAGAAPSSRSGRRRAAAIGLPEIPAPGGYSGSTLGGVSSPSFAPVRRSG